MGAKDHESKCFGNLNKCTDIASVLQDPTDSTARKVDTLSACLLIDPLTGLPNRFKLIQDISQNDCPVLFLIDIDGFSQINTHFGYETGDAVLAALAQRISTLMPPEAFRVYKLPGDEYALLTNIAQSGQKCEDGAFIDIPWEQLAGVARRLTSHIEKDRFMLANERTGENYDIRVNVSVGIAVGRIVGQENLLTHADIALKTAKKRRTPFLFYKQSRDTQRQYDRNIHWARILKDAIENDQFVPFFQPIQNNHTGRIEKFEALIRLAGDTRAPVAPSHFLEISKIVRLYPQIMQTMIAKSIDAIQKTPFDLSINLSIEDILNTDLLEFTHALLRDMNMGHRVTFEILESEGIELYTEVARFIRRFKAMGCKIAIDDFGIGYSNFLHVIKLDVDFLKIDASLIKPIDRDPNARVVVGAIVGFAKQLGIRTIGEGVDAQSVADAVERIGVDYSQGYLIGKPRGEALYLRSEAK